MTIHEVTFKFDSESMRHKALAVLFDEIRNLELLHNEADKRAETAEARIAAALVVVEEMECNIPEDPGNAALHHMAVGLRRALTEETP